MNQAVKKPNPAQILTEVKQQNLQVEKAAKGSIENIVSDYTTKVKTLDSVQIAKLAEVSKTVDNEITASQQAVSEKENAVEAALKALHQAEDALYSAMEYHEQKKSSLKEKFNKAAKDLKKSFATEKEAANKARQEALSAEKKKVADAKKAGRSAVWAETKALVDYEIFTIKDTSARILHGVQAIGKSLKTAFKAGYNAPTCIVVPKSLAERQDKPANDQPQPKA
jgi:Rad3-related DNA helicase